MLAATSSQPSPAATTEAPDASPPAADPTGELYDAAIAKEPPLAALPTDIDLSPATKLCLVRIAVQPAELPELTDLLASTFKALPTADLVGLQFVATPDAPAPALLAVMRGSPRDLLAAHPKLESRSEVTSLASGAADMLAAFQRSPSARPALVGDGDVELAQALEAPTLVRTVLVVKEHALGRAAEILSTLSAAKIQTVGVRLVRLDAQLGSAAQLGLDTPLMPSTVLAVLLEGFDVCERVIALCGATDSKLARTCDVGSIRARFGVDRVQNVVSTPRHDKGAKRCAAFFFGSRLSGSGDGVPVPLSFRLVRQPLLLLTTGTSERQRTAASTLINCFQRAGFALHGGARASAAVLDDIGVRKGGPARLAFLMSREGVPMALAAPTLEEAKREAGEALLAEAHPCTEVVARELLGSAAATSGSKDVFRYLLFALKSDIL